MPATSALTQQAQAFRVQVNGAPLDEGIATLMMRVVVDDNLNLPDMFVLTFRDMARTVVERAGIELGKKIKINALTEDTPGGEALIEGEVTALEAEFDSTGTYTIVRGYDLTHRLFRGRTTEAWQNATFSDVARRVAQRAGIPAGRIQPTSQVHELVTQGNVTDWVFLSSLARESGYVLTISDGRLNFAPPADADEAPTPERRITATDPLQLTLGTNLLRFRATVNAAEQVKDVVIRGWDESRKQKVTGRASAGTPAATVGVTPARAASTFGDRTFIGVDVPYAKQAEVDGAARAVADQIGDAHAELEGVARGNPKLRAGKGVGLNLVGAPFDGQYTLTRTRHIYDPRKGYETHFTVSGRQDRSLYGVASGGGTTTTSVVAGTPINGVVVAIVTDTKDPDKRGRVKLSFPWLSDDYVSDWVRTAQWGAGRGYGNFWLPEVNDEVLVAFDHGDLKRPFVVAGLFNGVDKPLSTTVVDPQTGGINERWLNSRKKHRLVFYDKETDQKVLLSTGDEKFFLKLDKTNTIIEIDSQMGKVKIHGQQDVEILSDANIKIKATANVDIEGVQVNVKGSAGAKVDGGAQTEIKGGIVRIN